MSTKVEVIVYQQKVKEIGQKLNFQIELPKDAKRIIGIEHSGMKLGGTHIGFTLSPGSDFVYLKDKLIGRLTLQVPGAEGIFYQNEMFEHINIAYGEPLTGVIWVMPVWAMSTRRDPIEISIDDNLSFIEGYYEDSWGKLEYSNLEYLLNIYLWVELK